MTAVKNSIVPGAARVAQVEGILKSDPVLAGKLGARDVEIQRRDGGRLQFHRLSYETTVALMAAGQEPLQIPKAAVFEAAKMIVDGASTGVLPVVVEQAATTEPKAEPKAKIRVEPLEPVGIPGGTPKTEPPKTEPPKTESPKAKSKAEPKTEPKVEPPKAEPRVSVTLAVYSLLLSAIELSAHDLQPGHAERRGKLEELRDAYREYISS